jgi:hypothetical protein|tara:strand:+ start:17411 stop:17764 length:354 start_codon:yes stop_codon:yes gene_type:complete
MATIANFNLRDRVKETTFKLVRFTITDETPTPIDLTGATIEADFRYRCSTGIVVKSIDTTAGITIENATSGIFSFNSFTPVSWTVDTYWYGVRITLSSGVIIEPVQGKVKILQNIPD